MKNLISFQKAFIGVIILNALVIVFHFCVLFQIIPFTIVWGGRLNSVEEMLVFELISISINIAIILVVFKKGKHVKLAQKSRFINGVVWLFSGIFLLNTIGNLFAETQLEMIIMTPVTALLCFFCVRIAME
jgi:hypothetical protein